MTGRRGVVCIINLRHSFYRNQSVLVVLVTLIAVETLRSVHPVVPVFNVSWHTFRKCSDCSLELELQQNF